MASVPQTFKEESMDDTVEITLKQKGEGMLAAIADIRNLLGERDKCLALLEFQAQLMLQGVDPEQVEKLGYDPRLDQRSKTHWNKPPLGKVYNMVYLKDGKRVDINPIPVPKGE
jgi:hypothetical protein